MGDANENTSQQGDANENPAQQGLPPRHLIIPYAVAAALAIRPIRLASQVQLLGCGGLSNQQPPAQEAIPAQRRRPSRNPWSRTVPSLLADGKSYRIIDTSFTSEEALAPAPPPLLVSAARRPTEPEPQPIATAFAWPVPPRGWTVSPTTGRYRFGYGYGGASSSSAAPRAPAAPTTPRAPTTLLLLPAPPVPAPLVPAPPAPAPPPAAPRGSTVSPTISRYSFGAGGARSSSATPRAPAPPAAAPRRLTVSPTTARYSFGYDGASSSSAAPRAPTASLALRAPAPHLRALRSPAPPSAALRGLTVSPTTARYSFGYGGASSSSAAPRVPTAPPSLRAPAPHLRALRAPAPHLRAPPAAAPPLAAPRGWIMPPTTGRYSFSYCGASSSSATPRASIDPLALRAPAPHLRAPRAPTAPPAAAAPAAPPAPPSGLVLVRPPTGPARARLAPAMPAEAFEEYLVERRAIEATVDDTPWEVIGSSKKSGGPIFAVAGGGRDRAELEAKEARERRKNRMDKRNAAAAARAQQQPPPLPADAPGSSGGGSKKREGGRKKKQA